MGYQSASGDQDGCFDGNDDIFAVQTTSGNLTIGFTRNPQRFVKSLVYVGHDEASGWRRTWGLVGQSDARVIPLTLDFDVRGVADATAKSLYFRNEGNATWKRIPVTGTLVGETLAFVLPEGWRSGQYRFMTESERQAAEDERKAAILAEQDRAVAAKTTVWFRANTGVSTNASGHVTGWANKGTLGSAADLVPNEDVSGALTFAADGMGGADIRRFPLMAEIT